MKYLWIRTSLVTMHAPCMVHTTAVGQRRRNYDVTIARHQTLRSHAWRITFTGGSRHALTPQYLDKNDSADRRRYSCDVIKTLQRQRPPAARLQKLLPQRLFADTPGTGGGRHRRSAARRRTPSHGLLMVMLIEIASVLCHSVITGGSQHVLTTPQYPDNTDNADRRRYSCDVIKTLRATEVV